MNMPHKLNIGLLVNPIAGLGGQVGLKGTDGVVEQALERGATPKALNRASMFLHALEAQAESINIFTVSGELGGAAFPPKHQFHVMLTYAQVSAGATQAKDMKLAAKALVAQDLDVLCFVGGDGTARDLADADLGNVPVVGIPAGVKMYSGVFAVSPESAAHVLLSWVSGKSMNIIPTQVRDIDEQAMRNNKVKTRFFGELWTPQMRLMQSVKISLQDDQAVMQQDIADYVMEQIIEANDSNHLRDLDVISIIGPGSTTCALKSLLDAEPSLLGVDVYSSNRQIAKDVWSQPILELLDQAQNNLQHTAPIYLFITFTAGQGFLLGRGNQQLSAELIARIGKANIRVLATQDKLDSLRSRPLLIDTGSKNLDAELSGYLQVITGYDETILYPVKAASDFQSE